MYRPNDPLALTTIPDRPTDHRHAPLQGGVADKPVGPEVLEQLLPQDDPVPVFDQIGQHREPLPVERDHADAEEEEEVREPPPLDAADAALRPRRAAGPAPARPA